jgi:RHS repeat-associated protein
MPKIAMFGAVRRRLAGVAVVVLLAGGVQAGAQEAALASPGRASASLAAAAARSAPATDAGMATRAGAAARAVAAARRSGHRTEITADRTSFSQTFANPGGSFTTVTSVLPRWVRRGTGWVAADAALVPAAGGSLAPRAALGGLTLSGGGGRVLAMERSGDRSLSVTWPQPLPAPQVFGARATYSGVFPGVDLVVTASVAGGFSETLVIGDKAAAADPQLKDLTLGVRASAGLTAHARAAGSVTVEDASGKPVFFSPAPAAWNSGARGSGLAGPAPGARTVPVRAAYSAGSVRMAVPASLLSGPASSFPVYVDPAYAQGAAWGNYGEIQSAYPNANELGATYDGDVSAGYDGGGIDRGEFVFGLPNPADSAPVTITSATMTATAVKTFTSSPTSHTINASYVTQYTSTSTWNSPPALIAGPSAQAFTTTSTTPDQNVSWNPASWLQSAYNAGAFQMTVQLANSDETGTGPFVEFGPSPTLTFTYTQPAPAVPEGTGPVPNATFLSFPISDKASLRVNAGSGNALFTTSDITLPEIGSSLVLGADYNSLLVNSAVNQGADRNGWRQRQGADVRLYLGAGASGTITLLGPGGTAGAFTAPSNSGTVYGSPPVFHATLTTTITSPCTGSSYQLTWHADGQVMCFNSAGLLTSQADRNGNATAFSYNGAGQETQVAYTPKGAASPTETVTATWTGSYLTGLSQAGGTTGTKTVTYAINGSGDLTSVQQPDGTTLTLGYDSSHDLTSIQNGAGATTTLTYNTARQVTSVTQPYGSGTATATTRLSYVSATETQVAAPTTNQSLSVSSVPHTTYTVNAQDLVTGAQDPAGDTRSATYTPFNDVASYTNGAGGLTTSTYTSNSGESLNATQGPMGATTKLAYGNAATAANPTAPFQPSTSTDAQGNATAYTYDGAGNLSQASNAMGATAKVHPNGDGTPGYSTDPANAASGNHTTYNYANSANPAQLTSVTPVTGSSLHPQTITYDGFGRVATVTDGDGSTVTYTYDLADRITQQAYTGGTSTLTVTYSYDGAGNLHTQTDASGTTTWTYDGRNQVLTKNAASGGGTLAYGYDADGNLTSAADAGGTTTYAYNTLDQLSSLTDESGKLWEFAYNADGQRTTTWFATNTAETTWAMKTVTGYDLAGRISRIQAYRNSSTSNVVSDVSYCYSPYIAGTACPTAQASTDKALLQYSVNNQTSTVSRYTYDAAGRLTAATNYNGTSYAYTYDADGNALTGTNKGTQTYNPANQATDTGYTYDGAGNLTATPGNGTLTYNDAGQWTGASNAGGHGPETLTYAGATQNQPLSDGSATAITYGLAGQYGEPWVQSYTPAGSTADYVLRDQQGDPLGYVQSGTAYAYVTDNQGSVTNVISSSGTDVATYSYDPYGHGGTPTGVDAAQNLLRYTGALVDPNSSNYSTFGARWYNPVTAFFTTQDTNSYLASPQNGNRYAYAAANPLNYTDPTGRSILGCIGAIVGTVASVGAVVGLSIGTAGTADVLAAGVLIAGAGTAAEQVSFFSAAAAVAGTGASAAATC